MPNVSEYVQNQYGIQSYVKEGHVMVAGNTPEQVLVPQDPMRYNLLIINYSPYDIYIATEINVGIGYGIKLSKQGGIFSCDAFTDMTLASHMWYCYVDGGDADVYILENKSLF